MPDHEEAVREAWGSFWRGTITRRTPGELEREIESAIRASERAKYAALVEAAQEFNYAPEDVPNQDEQGGCVFCAGSPPGKPYGYARKVEHHRPDCSWMKVRAALAALQSKEGTNE